MAKWKEMLSYKVPPRAAAREPPRRDAAAFSAAGGLRERGGGRAVHMRGGRLVFFLVPTTDFVGDSNECIAQTMKMAKIDNVKLGPSHPSSTRILG